MPERHIGQNLGRFRIDSLVGSGGFAWVYKGYDPELDVPVAVKVLKPQFAGDEMFETRFRREASTAAKLRHPNIINILAVGREGDAVYFAMDFLSQGLVDRLRVMGTLPDTMLMRVAFDVASALGFAHRQGVIHRDVKVDNIMFDDHGNAIVTDFGIARAVSQYAEQTGTNMVVGTPQYFSPEQARGLQLDGRADLYSLGVTLFKAATGVLPFQGEDWYEIARQHVEDKPPNPRELNPALSKGMERVILTCLEKDPDDRFPNGEAMCAELSHLLPERGEASSARTLLIPATDTLEQSSPRSRLFRFRKRTRRRLALGGVAVALFTVSVVALAARSRRDGSAEAALTPALESPPPITSIDAAARGTVSAPKPVMAVSGPAGAAISINGTEVAKGTWQSDTLSAGQYEVVASVAALPGCPSARDADTVALDLGDTVSVKLAPRSCGHLRLEAVPERADYTLENRLTKRQRKGELPMSDSLMLPVGTYDLTLRAPYCGAYNAAIQIEERRTALERIRLFCPETSKPDSSGLD